MTKPIRWTVLAIALLLAACGGAPAVVIPGSSTGTPSATPAPLTAAPPSAAPPTVAPTAAPAAALSPVPRNRILVLGWTLDPTLVGVTNPLNTNFNTNSGHEENNLLWEGLAYYGIFADKEIPWLARSMDYTKSDFTELTIKLNPLARWNDGQLVTAQDVLFTFQVELDNEVQIYHHEFQQYVRAVQAVDEHTVVLTFKIPAPRFKFEVLTLKFDTGVEIVPAHALSSQADVTSYPGGLDLVHSGPYQLVSDDASRRVFDLRPDWWAVAAGLLPAPAVKRVIVVDISPTSISMDKVAAMIINNELDATIDLRPTVIANVLKNNPKVTTYSGNAPPFGDFDWWPNALWVNTQLAPYSDVNVRRALSLAIDRDRINQDLYQGAPLATIYPFPLYPGLQRFADSPEVKALESKYQPRKFDLAESAQLMTTAGFSLNADRLWAKGGHTLDATVNAVQSVHTDLAPLLVEMLRRAGFDASVNFSSTAYDNTVNGSPGLYLFGHGASMTDPYAAFELFHSRHSAPAGTAVTGNFFSRYNNPAYDQLIDAMAVLPADDPRFHALAVQAMEIYWRDVIDMPVVQWLHRIPYNQTYWTNWPTQDNLALGTEGAFSHHTGILVITSLKPAQ